MPQILPCMRSEQELQGIPKFLPLESLIRAADALFFTFLLSFSRYWTITRVLAHSKAWALLNWTVVPNKPQLCSRLINTWTKITAWSWSPTSNSCVVVIHVWLSWMLTVVLELHQVSTTFWRKCFKIMWSLLYLPIMSVSKVLVHHLRSQVFPYVVASLCDILAQSIWWAHSWTYMKDT